MSRSSRSSRIYPPGLQRPVATLRRTLDGLSILARHELSVLGEHRDGLRERARVACHARSLGELLQNQVDLWPATRQRLRCQRVRRSRVWSGVVSELRAPAQDSERR